MPPGPVAVHWDATGTPDKYYSKPLALAMLPALSAGILVLFEAIPRIDPLGENIRAFETHYDRFVWLTLAFLLYVHVLVILWNAGYAFSVGVVLSPGIAALYYYVGTVMEHAEQNWFVGIRTPWTLSSEAVWRKTHDRTAWLFRAAGVIALAGVVVPDEFVVYVLVAPVAAVALYATLYSYLAYRRVESTA